MKDHLQGQQYRSFFWIYSPVDIIAPKKQKDRDVSTYLHTLAKTQASANPVLAVVGDPNHTHDIDRRQMNVAQQYRFGNQEQYHPEMSHPDEIEQIVHTLQGTAHHHDPIKMGGSSMEMIRRGNKVHITLLFNKECQDPFNDLHQDLRASLFNHTNFGGVKPMDSLRLFLAKGYNHEFRGRDLPACCDAFNHAHTKFKTKPIVIDRLVLGQGFFTEDGTTVLRRDVATIGLDGTTIWHCHNPFDRTANDNLIRGNNPEPATVGRPKHPSLVS